jgi:hypothetical protein
MLCAEVFKPIPQPHDIAPRALDLVLLAMEAASVSCGPPS